MADVVIRQKFLVAYIILAIAFVVLFGAGSLGYNGLLTSQDGTIEQAIYYGLAFLMAVAFATLFLKWLANRYIFTDSDVVSVIGIITQTKRTIPYSKVDNIVTKRSLIDLVLGTGNVVIDTPGGNGHEMTLAYVDAGKLTWIENKLTHNSPKLSAAKTTTVAEQTVGDDAFGLISRGSVGPVQPPGPMIFPGSEKKKAAKKVVKPAPKPKKPAKKRK